MDVPRTIKCDSYWNAMWLESALQEHGVHVRRPDDGLSLVASGPLDKIEATLATLREEIPDSGPVIIEGEDRDDGAPQQPFAPPPGVPVPSSDPEAALSAQAPESPRSTQTPQPPRTPAASPAPEPPFALGASLTRQPYSGGDLGAGHGLPTAPKAHPTEMETAGLAMTAHAAGDERDRSAGRPSTAAAEVERELNPLQQLIHQRMREQGWSYGEVARRGEIPRSTVYTLASTRNLARPPRPATLDGLAKGLDVPVSAIRAAAAESTALHYYDEVPAGREHHDDPERELLMASIDELTPEDRRHVAALVESLRKRASPKSADG
jgi:transcriptional regulator with XRE-family HTH domain